MKNVTMEGKESIDALFLQATEGILVANGTGEIIRFNPSAEKLFGYLQEELLGQKIERLIPKRFSAHQQHREKFHQNPHARSMGAGMDLYALRKDGSEFPVEISLSPYNSGDEKFVICFIVDITLRKYSEEKLKNYSAELEQQVRNRTLILEEAIQELEKTKKELNASLSKEKELNEMKSRFVSMASHEFRTPLTTMMSSLSLVTKYGEQNDKDNQSKHVTKIKNSIHNLTDILNDFLSVSKLEEGKIENSPEPTNVHSFVNEVVNDMRAMTSNGQEIHYSHSGDAIGLFDKKLLKNILFNLISNAIKFSPGKTQIQIGTSLSPSAMTVWVKDQGIGISEQDQQHLFERFFRGNNATHIQGTGLGLNIIARYAELMQATIHFESKEHQGTTFTVTIPQ